MKRLSFVLGSFVVTVFLTAIVLSAIDAFSGPPPDPKLGDRTDHFVLGLYLWGFLLALWSTIGLAAVLLFATKLLTSIPARLAVVLGIAGGFVAQALATLGFPNWLGRQVHFNSGVEVPLIAGVPGLLVGILTLLMLFSKAHWLRSRRVA